MHSIEHDDDEVIIQLTLGPFRKIKLAVLHQGRPLSYFSTKLPRQLRNLVKESFSHTDIHDQLIRFLENDSPEMPIRVVTQTGVLDLNWDPEMRLHKKTELNIDSGEVFIRKASGNQNKVFFIDDTLVADLTRKKLGLLIPGDGWTLFDQFFDLADPPKVEVSKKNRFFVKSLGHFDQFEQPIQIHVNHFNFHQIQFSEKDVVLRNHFKIAAVQRANAKYQLSIKKDPYSGKMILKGELRIQETMVDPDMRLFDSFYKLKSLNDRFRHSSLVGEIRNLMMNLVFDAPDLHDKLVHSFLEQYPFKSDREREILTEFIDDYREEVGTPSFRLCVHHGKWTRIDQSVKKEIAFWSIPYKVFGKEVFSDQGDAFCMHVPRAVLFKKLVELQGEFEKHDIEAMVDDKPIKSVHWDFSIDATNEDDWASLKPNVTWQKKSVDESLWMHAMDVFGVLETDDKVLVLDEKTQAILSQLLTIFPKEGLQKNPKQKKDRAYSRLKILDWLYLRSQGVRVKLSTKNQALFEKLFTMTGLTSRRLASNFTGTLRAYQMDGYNWMSFLYEHGFGACLADDMGLGKTVQAICLLAAIKEGLVNRPDCDGTAPHLIVVPASLIFNWRHELDRFAPGFRILEYHGKHRQLTFKDIDIIIVSYDIVRKEIEVFKKKRFGVIIFDEVQYVKNLYSRRALAVQQLDATFKLCLTGTPMENHIGEYFSIIDLVLPGLLGTYTEFKDAVSDEQSERLLRRTRPFVLRRTKEGIDIELPPKTESSVYLEFNAVQKKLYEGMIQEVKKKVSEAFSGKKSDKAVFFALTLLLRLRQICISPQLLDKKLDGMSPKIEYVIETLVSL
ncbi:MAG: hypothetical protein ACI9BD_000510, partial [Candidatus Marinamargulisbacteria bacterium]